jgi:20S proteasome alpha/beta subunit
MGNYVQAYTLYQVVRPFGVTSIIGGWDSEAEVPVDGQVGSGPKVGAGGKKEDGKRGGPFLYMIEPSGLYWVLLPSVTPHQGANHVRRGTTVQLLARDVKLPSRSWKS